MKKEHPYFHSSSSIHSTIHPSSIHPTPNMEFSWNIIIVYCKMETNTAAKGRNSHEPDTKGHKGHSSQVM
jgi:hypothetical protein